MLYQRHKVGREQFGITCPTLLVFWCVAGRRYECNRMKYVRTVQYVLAPMVLTR